MPDPAIGQNDVGIQNFARGRVHAAWPNGCSYIVVQPSNEVVTDVFGILFHVNTALGILILDHNRVNQTYFFKRLVPVVNTSFDPSPIANRSGMFDIKANGFLGRTELQAGITFLQFPTVDESDASIVVFVSAQVRKGCGEVAHTLISLTRLVAGCGTWHFAERVVDGLQAATATHNLKGDFDVPREHLR